jgi:pyruvate formate lyase activating enzyme
MEIKGFQEVSFLDWPGKTSSVIFLNHCNFRCPYCHNAELAIGMESQNIPPSYVISWLYDRREWIDGIVISGGEPLLNRDLPEFLRALKTHLDISIKLDTNGSNPKLLQILLRENLVDKVSMDIKSPLEDERYSKICRTNINISLIEESINAIIDSNINYEFRTTVCPSLLKENDILQIATELSCIGGTLQEYSLQNFNPGKVLDSSFEDQISYSYDTLNKIKAKITNQCTIKKISIK